ncbi:hypothetical protein CUJ83_00510 [Methanocella sp. CWC-04]|uniref:Uncharacterized protein n=1 Tax=Methanooceanicella nereidis TaxID=2052831 RepID=A0AAP2R9J8_9EURY|nr:hypothetical protein [Methanocella sp. CWC-04]MCD1293478.1 hypothetical protein [Methanocella sp. CWC-04]
MRKLFLVKVIHTLVDMGSLKDSIIKEEVAKVGVEKWEEHQRRIEIFWEEKEKEIDNLDLDHEKTKIYQDGLPCGGDIGIEVVNDLAKKGSRNYMIVKNLMDKGATVMATENIQLLREEYQKIKEVLMAPTPEKKFEALESYEKIKSRLMIGRDEHIANTINSTLKEGETGILFIGAAHDIVSGLDKDIEVKIIGC